METKMLDILMKYIGSPEKALSARNELLDLFAVSGWLEIEGNESVFNEYAKFNCWCRFDDGTECKYEDEHPMAILTHFRCK